MFARLASARLLASAIFLAKSGSIPGGSLLVVADADVDGVLLVADGRAGRAADAGGGFNVLVGGLGPETAANWANLRATSAFFRAMSSWVAKVQLENEAGKSKAA